MAKSTTTDTFKTHEKKVLANLMRRSKKEIAKKAKRLKKLEITYVDTDELNPNKYNPNRQTDHDFELLLRSIMEDGFTQPVVVRKEKKGKLKGQLVIVDGEHRWRAGRALDMPQIPVVITDMTDEQMRIATLRHNRARGSEDHELMVGVFEDLRELGALDHAMDSLMIDEDEMDRLLEDATAAAALAGDEFNEAWLPQKDMGTSVGEAHRAPTAMTAEASDRLREQEKRIREAKNKEEREMIRRETNSLNIRLYFDGEDADVVRQVLGEEKAADRLLELCLPHYVPPPAPSEEKPKKRKTRKKK